nr:p60 [Sweet potato chlorotic stunt virus]
MAKPLLNSEFVKETFKLAFKTNHVNDKLTALNNVILQKVSEINRKDYRFNFGGKEYVLSSSYYVQGSDVYVHDDKPLEILKLLSVYIHHVEPKYLGKSPYPPQNLFGIPNYMRMVKNWRPYYDKTMNEYLNDNPELGCLFTMEQIAEKYPQVNETRRITLYRVCNSLGKLVDLDEISRGKLKAFEVKTSDVGSAVSTSITNNQLFSECVKVFKDFIVLNSTKAGREKIEVNKKFFTTFLQCLKPKERLGNLKDNPLLLAWFMNEFAQRTKSSTGFKDNYKAVVDLSGPLLDFIRKVFLVDLGLDEDSLFITFPKNSVVEIVDQIIPLANFHRNQNLPRAFSNSCDLPRDVDLTVSQEICKFVGRYVKVDDDLILDTMLFVFGRCTTNKKRWNSGFEVDFSILGTKVKFDSRNLWATLETAVKLKHPGVKIHNPIRQWANNRGDRARVLFKICSFKPGLFQTIPKIDSHMRFDFFKLLDLRLMSDSEKTSYYTLRLMTESRSNDTDHDFCNLMRWISAQ